MEPGSAPLAAPRPQANLRQVASFLRASVSSSESRNARPRAQSHKESPRLQLKCSPCARTSKCSLDWGHVRISVVRRRPSGQPRGAVPAPPGSLALLMRIPLSRDPSWPSSAQTRRPIKRWRGGFPRPTPLLNEPFSPLSAKGRQSLHGAQPSVLRGPGLQGNKPTGSQ